MSISCLGTCSNCSAKQFWLSDTMSLQLDDGRLKCLPHPGEGGACEEEGLTLAQASARGRLYRETFYVCRNCGKRCETIEKQIVKDSRTFTPRGAMKWGWGSALIIVPFLLSMGWRQVAVVTGATLLFTPVIYWWENRKEANALAARGLPRPDAPGTNPIAEPTAGCCAETVIGQLEPDEAGQLRAAGPCCDRPDWIDCSLAKDEDRVPCAACRQGVMVVSEHAIH